MTGHVFHPGHEELHGVTVVVNDQAGRTYVGRFHERGPRGLVLHDVAVHDPATATIAREDWLARQRRFGVQVSHRIMVVPEQESESLCRLADR